MTSARRLDTTTGQQQPERNEGTTNSGQCVSDTQWQLQLPSSAVTLYVLDLSERQQERERERDESREANRSLSLVAALLAIAEAGLVRLALSVSAREFSASTTLRALATQDTDWRLVRFRNGRTQWLVERGRSGQAVVLDWDCCCGKFQ